MMNDEEIRLEALRLAHGASSGDTTGTIDAARQYADFVLGTKDAEVVSAAKQLAEKIAA